MFCNPFFNKDEINFFWFEASLWEMRRFTGKHWRNYRAIQKKISFAFPKVSHFVERAASLTLGLLVIMLMCLLFFPRILTPPSENVGKRHLRLLAPSSSRSLLSPRSLSPQGAFKGFGRSSMMAKGEKFSGHGEEGCEEAYVGLKKRQPGSGW